MKKLIKLLTILMALGALGIAALAGFIGYVKSDLPQINTLEDYRPPMNSRIYARDGELLLEIGRETRDVVSFQDIPRRIVEAFLAAEDDNFYNHKGVDYWGIMRAFMVNLKAGRLVQGGSTITQQVAKSLLLSKERTLTRKVKDLLLAQKMEEKFSKEDILFLYLNQVYLGGGYYGVKAAFRGYFDKELKDASIAESALVAGLLVAPGRYSPYINPKYAKRRQNYVLGRLYETGKITAEEYEAAKNEVIKMRIRVPAPMKGGHFTDWVMQTVMDKVGKDEFLSNGFEVMTTLDWSLQERAELSVKSHVRELDKRQGFKGVLAHHKDQEAISQMMADQRAKIYRDRSTFFEFKTDGTNNYEFTLAEDESIKVQQRYAEEEKKSESRLRALTPIGVDVDDPLLSLIKPKEIHRAVVLKVDDQARMVYAAMAGLRVAIAESGFSWAHKRKVDDTEKWFPPVTKPSTILTEGDEIYVQLQGKPVTAWSLANEEYRKKLKDVSVIKDLQKQHFVPADLDQEPEAEGAFTAMDVRNGNILALVGGVDFQKSQFNRALQAARQPGSAFKPFIYAAALENGYTPSSILLDTPQALGGVDEGLSWKPRNYDGDFLGQMTFRRALEVSRNIPTIKILQDVGVDRMIEFSQRLGISAQLPKDMSIGLGSFGISLADLVKSYAIFANGGRKINMVSITSVKDREGKSYQVQPATPTTTTVETPPSNEEGFSLEENPYRAHLQGNQVYDPRLAYVMTNLLKGVVTSGTAAAARSLGDELAGKTGTTNNFVDALFVGYSAQVVAGAWVGLDDNRPMGYGEGGSKTALPIWMDVMKLGIQKYGHPAFTVPEGIVNILINKQTGRPAKSGETDTFMEAFAEGMSAESRTVTSPETGTEESTTPAVLEDDDYFINQ